MLCLRLLRNYLFTKGDFVCDIKLYQDDCINILKGIKENSIDCAILDPPYKLNKTTGSTLNSGLSNKWNKNLLAGDISANIENNIEFSEWLPYLYNVMKNGSHTYIFSNDKNLSDLVVEAEKVGFKLHNILVWKKIMQHQQDGIERIVNLFCFLEKEMQNLLTI